MRPASSAAAAAAERFAHVGDGPDGRVRADLFVGAEVDIILKADQSTGRVTRGFLRDFLTNSSQHPQGAAVQVELC